MQKRSYHVSATEMKSILTWFRKVFQTASHKIILGVQDSIFLIKISEYIIFNKIKYYLLNLHFIILCVLNCDVNFMSHFWSYSKKNFF